jgi:hypothetical protein
LVFERTRSQSQCSQELYNNPTQHKKNGNKWGNRSLSDLWTEVCLLEEKEEKEGKWK